MSTDGPVLLVGLTTAKKHSHACLSVGTLSNQISHHMTMSFNRVITVMETTYKHRTAQSQIKAKQEYVNKVNSDEDTSTLT